MPTELTVFGISPGSRGRFAFVPVAATVIERRLFPVVDPNEVFPTEGNIYVDESSWIPPEGTGAIWKVRNGVIYSPDRKHAEFSAYTRGRIGPLEIIGVPVSSAGPNSVRNCLCEGVELGYVPADNVLVRLENGVVVGPLRVRPWSEGRARGMISSEEYFAEPFSLWDDAARLEPFWVDDANSITRKRRRFVSFLDLPEPQSYFDAAGFADSFKSVLKAIQSADPTTSLSRRQLADLIKMVGDGSVPERLRVRTRRVLSALHSVSLTQDELEGVLPAALGNDSVAREIANARETAATDERRAMREQLQDEVKRIQDARALASTLEGRIEELEQQVAQGEAALKASMVAASDRIAERLHEILIAPERVLAEVAILRPLLSAADVRRSGNADTGPIPSRSDEILRPLDTSGSLQPAPADCDELVAAVEMSLRSVGLLSKSAKRVAREVVAVLAVGQVPMFRGSLGHIVAQSVATSLGGGRSYEVSVPVGLLDGELIDRALKSAASIASDTGRIVALVIEGVDRSAIEVFGGGLLRLTAEKVLSLRDLPGHIIVVGVMSGGPGSVPVSEALCDLGPVIDTDAFACTRVSKPGQTSHDGVSLDVWSKTVTALTNTSTDGQQDTLAGVVHLDIIGSVVWRRGIEAIAAALTAANPEDNIATSEALLGDWLVPRALAEGNSPSIVVQRSRVFGGELGVIGDSGQNGRIARVLARVEREGVERLLADSTDTLFVAPTPNGQRH